MKRFLKPSTSKNEIYKEYIDIQPRNIWNQHCSLWWTNIGNVPTDSASCQKIIAFDLDQTLVKTKSGKTHSENSSDWVPFHISVKKKLQQIAKSGNSKIVIFSNQLGVTTRNVPIEDIQQRIVSVLAYYDVPAQVFFAIADDIFRKPRPGAWDFMVTYCNNDVIPLLEECMFIGDAAGRTAIPKLRKKDFSDTDLKFSINLGINFQTPEEYFLGQRQTYQRTFSFDPRSVSPNDTIPPSLSPSNQQELILLIGSPGCGKTRLSRQIFPNYVHINQDTLRTAAKCLSKMKEALENGHSVIVDNQNRDTKTRKHYIDIASSLLDIQIPVRGIYFSLPKELSFHMNTYRTLIETSSEYRSDKVPPMVIHSFYKSREPPQLLEGFTEIIEINESNFKPGPFDNIDCERLFHMFLN